MKNQINLLMIYWKLYKDYAHQQFVLITLNEN